MSGAAPLRRAQTRLYLMRLHNYDRPYTSVLIYTAHIGSGDSQATITQGVHRARRSPHTPVPIRAPLQAMVRGRLGLRPGLV
jgi:hypothetical protein